MPELLQVTLVREFVGLLHPSPTLPHHLVSLLNRVMDINEKVIRVSTSDQAEFLLQFRGRKVSSRFPSPSPTFSVFQSIDNVHVGSSFRAAASRDAAKARAVLEGASPDASMSSIQKVTYHLSSF